MPRDYCFSHPFLFRDPPWSTAHFGHFTHVEKNQTHPLHFFFLFLLPSRNHLAPFLISLSISLHICSEETSLPWQGQAIGFRHVQSRSWCDKTESTEEQTDFWSCHVFSLCEWRTNSTLEVVQMSSHVIFRQVFRESRIGSAVYPVPTHSHSSPWKNSAFLLFGFFFPWKL